MTIAMRASEDRRWTGYRWWNRSALLALGLAALLAFSPSARAQELIDPRSGQLVLSVTDLTLQAGPVTLEIRRSLHTGKRAPGLLGTRWRLNWESRLVRVGALVLIEESTGSLSFSQQGPAGEYRSALGDRLVLEKTGRAVRTKLDLTKERFDVQGRLVERDYRNGNRAVVQYGPDGSLAKIGGPHGSALRFTIDKAGRLIQVEASTTATVRYVYQENELTEVQRPPAPPIRYSYFTGGQVARIEEPQSGTVQFAYDFKGRISRRQWADGSKERYEYDDRTNTIRQIDPAGGVTTIQWGQDGRQAEITNPLGHKSVIVSDAVGRPLQITGPTGASVRLTYDALGRTMAMENAAGQVTRFEYLEETSRPSAMLHPDGTRQLFEYDRRGNLMAIKLGTETLATFTYHPDGSVATAKGVGTPERRLTYNPAGRLTAVANALGQTTQFQYGTQGNLLQETNPLGGVTRYQYDAQGRPVSRTDPVGGITRYEYDPQGRLRRIIDPIGGMTRYDYDARGRLVAETNPAGQATRYDYAVSGRLAAVIAPDGTTERFRYDALGNQTEWTDRLGRRTAFTYDPLGRISREHWPTGLEIRYRYDALGNLVGVEDMTGAKSEFERNPLGQLTALVDPLGAITRYQYDSLGNLLALTDPRGQSKRFAYTPEGRVARAQEASGDGARYEYDQTGRLVAVQRPSGGVTRFSYDAMGNITAEADPLGNRWRHTYDAAGRLVSSTDAAGQTTRYSYDPSGRLMGKVLPDDKRVSYQYDPLGKLVFADDGAFPIRRSYDPAGRLVRVEYPAIKKAVGYEYDGSGLRTKLIDSAGRATRYEYTIQKKLAAIILPDGKRISLTYDEKERLGAIRYPNGIAGRWEYGADDRISKIAYADQNGNILGKWMYRYDATGNLVEQEDHQRRVSRFQYDAAGQLTEAAGSEGTTRYRYLPGGNRAAVDEGGTLRQYRHDAADRVLQAGDQRFTHDANGNRTARTTASGTTRYEFDTEGQLIKVVPPSATIAFGYAPTGERAWRGNGNERTYFIYDGLDLIGELSETGALRATYVYGPGIDQPLAMIRDGRTYYYHADRLASIRLLTDEQGQVVAAYDYDAFGKPRTSQGSVSNPFTFTGREWDDGTGLYYYRARYYDPVLGRFLSTDPAAARIDQPLELNPYAYVRNNPLRYVDPLGLTGGPVVPPPFLDPDPTLGATVPLRPRPPVFGGGWETLPESPTNVANKLARIEDRIGQWRGRGPNPVIKDWRPGGGMVEGAPQPDPRLGNLRHPYWQQGWDLMAERQRLRQLLPPGQQGADLLARAGEAYHGPPQPPKPAEPFAPRSPARHLQGGLASFQQPGPGMSAATLEATATRWVLRGGSWVLIAIATGKILTSDDPGGAALDAAVGIECTVIGSCLGGPAGGLIGGLLGPPVLDSLAGLATSGAPPPPPGVFFDPRVPSVYWPGKDPTSVVVTTLIFFGVSCSPSTIKVGESSSCKATGQYSTELGVAVDLTHSAAWAPGPTIIGDWPGSWVANASYAGKSASATVTVIADDKPPPPPDIKGASEQPFGGVPPGTPTSGATGGQVVEQPGLKPPPTGTGEAGTTPGQPPPQQGYWCYSEKSKEWYWIPMGPCPPPHMKPPPTTAGEPGRIPWQGLVPPGETVAPATGQCPPGCHIKPATGKCHCGGM